LFFPVAGKVAEELVNSDGIDNVDCDQSCMDGGYKLYGEREKRSVKAVIVIAH
jgi:hypothetical protein